MEYSIEKIGSIINGEFIQLHQNDEIGNLLLDSRKINSPLTSLFFALKGPRSDGHLFIAELYEKGIRNFVVSEKSDIAAFPEGNFLLVDDTLTALQQLAAYHRNQ